MSGAGRGHWRRPKGFKPTYNPLETARYVSRRSRLVKGELLTPNEKVRKPQGGWYLWYNSIRGPKVFNGRHRVEVIPTPAGEGGENDNPWGDGDSGACGDMPSRPMTGYPKTWTSENFTYDRRFDSGDALPAPWNNTRYHVRRPGGLDIYPSARLVVAIRVTITTGGTFGNCNGALRIPFSDDYIPNPTPPYPELIEEYSYSGSGYATEYDSFGKFWIVGPVPCSLDWPPPTDTWELSATGTYDTFLFADISTTHCAWISGGAGSLAGGSLSIGGYSSGTGVYSLMTYNFTHLPASDPIITTNLMTFQVLSVDWYSPEGYEPTPKKFPMRPAIATAPEGFLQGAGLYSYHCSCPDFTFEEKPLKWPHFPGDRRSRSWQQTRPKTPCKHIVSAAKAVSDFASYRHWRQEGGKDIFPRELRDYDFYRLKPETYDLPMALRLREQLSQVSFRRKRAPRPIRPRYTEAFKTRLKQLRQAARDRYQENLKAERDLTRRIERSNEEVLFELPRVRQRAQAQAETTNALNPNILEAATIAGDQAVAEYRAENPLYDPNIPEDRQAFQEQRPSDRAVIRSTVAAPDLEETLLQD